jgi:hypothetical protein
MAMGGIVLAIFVLTGVTLYVANARMTKRHNSQRGTSAFFVGVAEIVPEEPHESAIPGTLVVDADGFTFTASPKWNQIRGVSSNPPRSVKKVLWSEISSTALRPHPNKPLPGLVDLHLSDGTILTFRVNLFRRLSKALAARSISASPAA